MNRHHNHRQFVYIIFICYMIPISYGQRFLRQGFSNNEDFGSEMKLDDTDNTGVDMTREMFIMQDLLWQIQSPIQQIQQHTMNDNDINPIIRHHLQKYIFNQQSIDVRLFKKRGKFGLRAMGKTSNTKQKLRAFWRQPVSTSISPRTGIDFLKSSYDDACRSRLFTIEFELQLPPVVLDQNNNKQSKQATKKSSSCIPSVVYQVSLEPGSMNPKALVPRSAGRIFVYPNGRTTASSGTSSGSSSTRNDKVEIGKAYISTSPMKSGIIDPNWAKGRPIFRKGRNSGLM